MVHVSKLSWLALLAAGWAAAPTAGCIDTRCTQDRECPVGRVCALATGACVIPECVTHSECGGGGLVCRDHACEPGCLTDAECPEDHRCGVDLRCAPIGGDCGCPLAPTFCGLDLNPASSTWHETVCLPGDAPATALVFGSVLCSHCTHLLDGVLALGDRVGEDPAVVFIQLLDRPMDEATITAAFARYPLPVIHDSEELDVVGLYGTDWYHVVLVDGHGCLVGVWGTVFEDDMEGAVGDEIGAAWTRALTGACPD